MLDRALVVFVVELDERVGIHPMEFRYHATLHHHWHRDICRIPMVCQERTAHCQKSGHQCNGRENFRFHFHPASDFKIGVTFHDDHHQDVEGPHRDSCRPDRPAPASISACPRGRRAIHLFSDSEPIGSCTFQEKTASYTSWHHRSLCSPSSCYGRSASSVPARGHSRNAESHRASPRSSRPCPWYQ